MNSTIHSRKTVTQSSIMSQNNKEHRIHNKENSPYQVSKPYVKLYKKLLHYLFNQCILNEHSTNASPFERVSNFQIIPLKLYTHFCLYHALYMPHPPNPLYEDPHRLLFSIHLLLLPYEWGANFLHSTLYFNFLSPWYLLALLAMTMVIMI
jgi:hypothetical protein